MRKTASLAPKRRVRPLLLALLWIWAACVFLVLDLFHNVPEFDGIRPRARVYRAMRHVGHRMVGEPYYDVDFPDALPTPALRSGDVEELALEGAPSDADEIDRHLRIEGQDLGRLLGPHARRSFLETVLCEEEETVIRAKAARFLGRGGPAALETLDELLAAEQLEEIVRAGAVLGLGEVDTPEAADRALALASDPSTLLQAAGAAALKSMTSPRVCSVLIDVARDDRRELEVRVAACRSVGTFPGSAQGFPFLRETLGDSGAPIALRVGAARGLGLLGSQEAVDALEAASRDEDSEVARAARVARKNPGGASH